MIKIDDIIWCGFDKRKVIDVNSDEGYCIAILQCDIDGLVNQDEDNIAKFILLNDIDEQ